MCFCVSFTCQFNLSACSAAGVNISSVSLATNEELHGDITLSHDTFFTACRYGGEDLNCTDLFHGEYQLDKQ